jgi:hypothetical protein
MHCLEVSELLSRKLVWGLSWFGEPLGFLECLTGTVRGPCTLERHASKHKGVELCLAQIYVRSDLHGLKRSLPGFDSLFKAP